MKILLIAPARTSSTALAAYLAQINGSIENYNEKLSMDLEFKHNIYKNNNFSQLFPVVKEELKQNLDELFLNQSSFVVKFAGHHLRGLSQYIEPINPQRFDQIHLLERKNFFGQVCSLCVAKKEDIWIRTDGNSIRFENVALKENNFFLTRSLINIAAYDCKEYINCKKYLRDNNISYQQHYYESPIFGNQKIGSLLKTGLDYPKLIENYNEYTNLNEYFYQYFNYETATEDCSNFSKNLENWRLKIILKNFKVL